MKKNEENPLRKDRRAMIKKVGNKLLKTIDEWEKKIPVEAVEEFTHANFEDVKVGIKEYRNWLKQLDREYSLNESELSVIVGFFKKASLNSNKIGLVKISDLYFYYYRLFKRKLYFKKRSYNWWILYAVWGNISKFGTSPFRLFLWMLIIIFGFAFLAFLGGKCLWYSVEANYIDSFFESIYWSCITFSTLGYGDITPTSTFTQILASIESLSGIIMLGFFLELITKYHEFRKEG